MLTVQTRIHELVQQHLAGRNRANPVTFVDEILALSAEAGEVRCTMAGSEALRFEVSHGEPCEVLLDCAKAKLRACCARLGVLCNESGQDVNLYGGEGLIVKPDTRPPTEPSGNHDPRTWKVRFQNTMHRQEFVIEAQ
jgi:hypothetical protein